MNKKTTIFFSAILAVLSVYFFLFETDENHDPKIKNPNIKKIFDIEKSNINKIILNKNSGKIILVKKNDKWFITEPEKKRAKTQSVNEYISMLFEIEIIMSIDDNPEDISIFGLKNPLIEIILQQKDIKTISSIMVGGYNPNMTCVYAKTNSSPEILLIGSLFKNDLDKDVDFFIKPEGN